MQPRAGGAAAAFDPDQGQPAGQGGAEQQQRNEVGEHQRDPDIRPHVAGRAGEQPEGGDADRER